jgi:hypothetical protein
MRDGEPEYGTLQKSVPSKITDAICTQTEELMIYNLQQ